MIQMARYKHAEAFCLMQYEADDLSEVEWIWNSRDGVCPFVITLRSGKPATHVRWNEDIRREDFQPPKGSRMFIDLTWERARQVAKLAVNKNLQMALEKYGTETRAIAEIAQTYMARPGIPDLVVVK